MTHHRWYVATPFAHYELEGGYVVERPSAEAHAKTMGTSSTACGRPTGSWAKIFDLPFPIEGGANCRVCLDAVRLSDGG